jgi:hypothetical protein
MEPRDEGDHPELIETSDAPANLRDPADPGEVVELGEVVDVDTLVESKHNEQASDSARHDAP